MEAVGRPFWLTIALQPLRLRAFEPVAVHSEMKLSLVFFVETPAWKVGIGPP